MKDRVFNPRLLLDFGGIGDDDPIFDVPSNGNEDPGNGSNGESLIEHDYNPDINIQFPEN